MQFDSLAERLDEKKLPGEFPAECLSYTQPREGGTAPHRHDCMEIGLCVEGGGVLRIGGRMYTFLPGSIDVIRRGCVHDANVVPRTPREQPSRWKFIFADTEALGIAVSAGSGFLTSDAQMRALFELMFTELSEKRDGWQAVFTELFRAFALLMRRAEPEDSPDCTALPPEMAGCLRYIGCMYASPLSVEALARECHMSRSSFCRMFRQYTGVPPMRYISRLRLTVARHLVQHTDEPILQISQECGFCTLSSFNRQFVKEFSIPPREMRRKEKDRST